MAVMATNFMLLLCLGLFCLCGCVLGCRTGHLESVRLSESHAKYQSLPGGTIAGKSVVIQED